MWRLTHKKFDFVIFLIMVSLGKLDQFSLYFIKGIFIGKIFLMKKIFFF